MTTETSDVLVTPEVKAMIGRKGEPEVGIDEVTRGDLRRYVLSTMDDNRLWYDTAYAETTKFGVGCAPASFVLRMMGRRPMGKDDKLRNLGTDKDPSSEPSMNEDRVERIPWPEGVLGFHGGDDIEYLQLPKMGDVVTSVRTFVDAFEKTGRNGKFAIAKSDTVFTNDKGEVLVIEHFSRVARRMRPASEGTPAAATPIVPSNTVVPSGPAPTELPRYEDIEVGTRLPERSQLLSIPVMHRWCIATETMRRNHYDDKYSMEHEGLPGALLSGHFSQAFVYQLLFNLVAPEGWVYRVMLTQRAMVHPGSELTFFGIVTDKYEKNGLGYVEVDTGLRIQDGSVPVPGHAILVLPLAGGKPVPYPFVP